MREYGSLQLFNVSPVFAKGFEEADAFIFSYPGICLTGVIPAEE